MSSNKRFGTSVRAGKRPVTHQQVRSMIRGSLATAQELKVYDISSSANAYSTTGTVSPVTQGIIQGDSITQRDGDVVVIKDVLINVNFVTSSATNSFRMILFRDRMAFGATPAVTDVLVSASYISGYNQANQQTNRFQIIHDQTYTQVLAGSTGCRQITLRHKGSHKCVFKDITNVSTANGPGAFFVLFIAGAASGTYDLNYHVRFTDS